MNPVEGDAMLFLLLGADPDRVLPGSLRWMRESSEPWYTVTWREYRPASHRDAGVLYEHTARVRVEGHYARPILGST
jgi:hypothetical protein